MAGVRAALRLEAAVVRRASAVRLRCRTLRDERSQLRNRRQPAAKAARKESALGAHHAPNGCSFWVGPLTVAANLGPWYV